MSSAILSYKNAADTATVYVPRLTVAGADSWLSTAPLTNLLQPLVGKAAQSASTASSNSWFSFKLASVVQASVVAVCNHNLSQDAQVRLHAGMSILDMDLANYMVAESRLSRQYAGGANGTAVLESGVIVTAITPRTMCDASWYTNGFLGSDALSQWAAALCVIHSDDRTVSFTNAGSFAQGALQLFPGTYTVSGKAQLVSGNGDFKFRVNDGTERLGATTLTATSDWQDFTQTITVVTYTLAGISGVQKVTGAGIMRFKNMQIERGPVKTNYKRTTNSARRFRVTGVLKEPARTNICLQSQTFGTTWTTAGSLTVTSDTVLAPSGAVAGETLTNTASGVDAMVTQTIANTGLTCFSVFVKKNNSAQAKIRVATTATVATDDSVFFNFSTFAFTGATANFQRTGFEVYDGGWFRVWAVKAAQAGQTQSIVRVAPADAAGAITAGDTVYVWGAQVEAAENPSSYIPTTTVAVARTADAGNMNDTAPVPLVGLNSAEGTLYVEFEVPAGSTSGSTATSTDLIRLRNTANSFWCSIRYNMSSGGVNGIDAASSTGLNTTDSATIAANTIVRCALRYRNADWAFYKDGVQVGTGATAFAGTLNAIDLFATPGLPFTLRRVAVWRDGKDNTTLAALSASGPAAVDYDSGWIPAKQLSLSSDIGDRAWGSKHDLQFLLPATVLEYGSFQVDDPGNLSANISLGRLFIGQVSFQSKLNMSWGATDAVDELSSQFETPGGTRWSQERDRPKKAAFSYGNLTLAEADQLHEMQAYCGIVQEVYYVPNPSDVAYSQRYGFLGTMNKLDPLAYPQFATKAASFELRQKR